MTSTWTAKFLNLINTHDEIKMGEPATDMAIENAESDIGIAFPEEFRAYLKAFGHLEIGHVEVYGLGLNIPDYLSIVRETLAERKMFRPFIPVRLLPVVNDGSGNHFCLDLSSANDDPPVVFWNHEDDEQQTPDMVSESFTSWLVEVADEVLEVQGRLHNSP